MGAAAALANYFILLPLFETFMPLDQLIASFGAFLPFIHTKLDIVLFNALPFNILKGLVIGGFMPSAQGGFYAGGDLVLYAAPAASGCAGVVGSVRGEKPEHLFV